jgi:accessory gene regulator protein AgrB
MLCKYKDIFGKVGEGGHAYRILNIAVVDVLFTIVGAYLIHLYIKQNFWIVLSVLFAMGILFHRIFCVRTTIDKILFR